MLDNYHSSPTFEDTHFSIFLDGKIKAQRGTSHTTQGEIIKSFEILKNKSKQKFLNSMIAPPDPALPTPSSAGENALFQRLEANELKFIFKRL